MFYGNTFQVRLDYTEKDTKKEKWVLENGEYKNKNIFLSTAIIFQKISIHKITFVKFHMQPDSVPGCVRELYEKIKKHHPIKQMDFSGHNLSGIFGALMHQLIEQTDDCEFDFSNCNITDDDLKNMAQQFYKLGKPKGWYNSPYQEGRGYLPSSNEVVFQKSFYQNKNIIRKLNLSNNQFTAIGFLNLLFLLSKSLIHLEQINLVGNAIELQSEKGDLCNYVPEARICQLEREYYTYHLFRNRVLWGAAGVWSGVNAAVYSNHFRKREVDMLAGIFLSDIRDSRLHIKLDSCQANSTVLDALKLHISQDRNFSMSFYVADIAVGNNNIHSILSNKFFYDIRDHQFYQFSLEGMSLLLRNDLTKENYSLLLKALCKLDLKEIKIEREATYYQSIIGGKVTELNHRDYMNFICDLIEATPSLEKLSFEWAVINEFGEKDVYKAINRHKKLTASLTQVDVLPMPTAYFYWLKKEAPLAGIKELLIRHHNDDVKRYSKIFTKHLSEHDKKKQSPQEHIEVFAFSDHQNNPKAEMTLLDRSKENLNIYGDHTIHTPKLRVNAENILYEPKLQHFNHLRTNFTVFDANNTITLTNNVTMYSRLIVLKGKHVVIKGTLEAENIFIEAEKVTISPSAELRYHGCLAINAGNIEISGYLNGSKQSATLLKASHDLTIDKHSRIQTHYTDFKASNCYYTGMDTHMVAGDWQFTQIFYNGLPSSVDEIKKGNFYSNIEADARLNIVCGIYLGSPLARLHASGKTTALFALDANILKKGRTIRALVDVIMLLNAPWLDKKYSQIFQLAPELFAKFALALQDALAGKSTAGFEFSFSDFASYISYTLPALITALGFVFPQFFFLMAMLDLIPRTAHAMTKLFFYMQALYNEEPSQEKIKRDDFDPSYHLSKLNRFDNQVKFLHALDLLGDAGEISADIYMLQDSFANFYGGVKGYYDDPGLISSDLKGFFDKWGENRTNLVSVASKYYNDPSIIYSGCKDIFQNWDSMKAAWDTLHKSTLWKTYRTLFVNTPQKFVSLWHQPIGCLDFFNNTTIATLLSGKFLSDTFASNLREVSWRKINVLSSEVYEKIFLKTGGIKNIIKSQVYYKNGRIVVPYLENDGTINMVNVSLETIQTINEGKFHMEGGSFSSEQTHNKEGSNTKFHNTNTVQGHSIEDGDLVMKDEPDKGVTHVYGKLELGENCVRDLKDVTILAEEIIDLSKTTFYGDNVIMGKKFLDIRDEARYLGDAVTLISDHGTIRGYISPDKVHLYYSNFLEQDVDAILANQGQYEHFRPKSILTIDLDVDYHYRAQKVSQTCDLGIIANAVFLERDAHLEQHLLFKSKTGDIEINQHLSSSEGNNVYLDSAGNVYMKDLNNGTRTHASWEYDAKPPAATVDCGGFFEVKAEGDISQNGKVVGVVTHFQSQHGKIDNWGTIVGTDHVSLEALAEGQTITNHGVTTYLHNGYQYVSIWHASSILGGAGAENAGVGVDIHAQGELINDASDILAKGSVHTDTRGVKNVDRSETYLAMKYTHHGVFGNSTEHIYQSQSRAAKIGSFQSSLEIRVPEGDLYARGSTFFAADRIYTDIQGRQDYHPSIALERGESHSSGFLSSSRDSYFGIYYNPCTLVSGQSISLNSRDGEVLSRNSTIVTPKLTMSGTNTSLEDLPEFTAYESRRSGLSLSSIGLFGHQVDPNAFSRGLSAFDDMGFLHEFRHLASADNPSEAMRAAYFLALTNPDASREVLNVLTDSGHAFDPQSLYPDLSQGPQPNFAIQHTSSSSSFDQQTRGAGRVDCDVLVMNADHDINLSGVDLSHTRRAEFHGERLNLNGMPLYTASRQRSTGFSFNPFTRSGAVSLQSESYTQQYSELLELSSDSVLLDVNEVNLRDARIMTRDLSGHPDRINMETSPTTTEYRTQSFNMNTQGGVSYTRSSLSDRDYSHPSAIYAENVEDFCVRRVVNKGGVLYGIPDEAIGDYQEIPVQGKRTETSSSAQFNLNSFFVPGNNSVTRFSMTTQRELYNVSGMRRNATNGFVAPDQLAKEAIEASIRTRSSSYDLRFLTPSLVRPQPASHAQVEAVETKQEERETALEVQAFINTDAEVYDEIFRELIPSIDRTDVSEDIPIVEAGNIDHSVEENSYEKILQEENYKRGLRVVDFVKDVLSIETEINVGRHYGGSDMLKKAFINTLTHVTLKRMEDEINPTERDEIKDALETFYQKLLYQLASHYATLPIRLLRFFKYYDKLTDAVLNEGDLTERLEKIESLMGSGVYYKNDPMLTAELLEDTQEKLDNLRERESMKQIPDKVWSYIKDRLAESPSVLSEALTEPYKTMGENLGAGRKWHAGMVPNRDRPPVVSQFFRQPAQENQCWLSSAEPQPRQRRTVKR